MDPLKPEHWCKPTPASRPWQCIEEHVYDTTAKGIKEARVVVLYASLFSTQIRVIADRAGRRVLKTRRETTVSLGICYCAVG